MPGVGLIAGGNTVINPYVPTQILAVPAATSQMTMFPSYGTEWSELNRLKDAGEMIEVVIRDGYNLYIPKAATTEGRERSAAKANAMVDEYVGRETAARRSATRCGGTDHLATSF